MKSDTFIKLPKNEVIFRCESAIKYINNRRKEEDDNYIKRKIKRKNYWRKLFGMKTITFEKGKEIYKDHYDFFEFPSITGSGTLYAAERILDAAKVTKKKVYISSSDLQYIRFF